MAIRFQGWFWWKTRVPQRQVGVFLQGHKACWLTPVSVEDTAYQEALNHSMYIYMDVSLNGGTSKSSILIGFSIINNPFWGNPIFGNTHILLMEDIRLTTCDV